MNTYLTGKEEFLPNYEYFSIVSGVIMSQIPFDLRKEAMKFFNLQSEGLDKNNKNRIILRRHGKIIKYTWR